MMIVFVMSRFRVEERGIRGSWGPWSLLLHVIVASQIGSGGRLGIRQCTGKSVRVHRTCLLITHAGGCLWTVKRSTYDAM